MAQSVEDIVADIRGGGSGGGGMTPPGIPPGQPGGGGIPPWLPPPGDPFDPGIDSVLGGAAQVGGAISPTNTLSLNIGDVGGTMSGGAQTQSGITGRDAISSGNGGKGLFSEKNILWLGLGALVVILVINKRKK